MGQTLWQGVKPPMLTVEQVEFIENPAAASRPDAYLAVRVRADRVLKSWRSSLFAHEWMRPDGQLKAAAELAEGERAKRETIEESLRRGAPLEKPVLGIGLLECVEIGAGRAVFLTLAAQGMTEIPVHIPASQQKEFKPFLA